MTPLWSRLQSALAAAGLVLSLAACRSAAPSSDGAAQAPAQSLPEMPPSESRPAPAKSGTPPAAPNPESLVELSQTDPRAALLAAANHDLGPSATYLRGNFLQLWAQRDFTSALAYADELQPGVEREEMLGRLALLLAESLPADAADIVARDMAPGPVRDEAAISVLHRWARLDPAAAKAWASAFPFGPLRERALHEVAGAIDTLATAATIP